MLRKIGHAVLGLIASGVAAISLIGTQAMTGREGLALFGYPVGWFLLFGLAAALPTLSSATRRQAIFPTFLPFGFGGAIAGFLIAILLATHQLGGSSLAVMIDFAIPFSVPWIVGGAAIKFRNKKSTPGSPADR